MFRSRFSSSAALISKIHLVKMVTILSLRRWEVIKDRTEAVFPDCQGRQGAQFLAKFLIDSCTLLVNKSKTALQTSVEMIILVKTAYDWKIAARSSIFPPPAKHRASVHRFLFTHQVGTGYRVHTRRPL